MKYLITGATGFIGRELCRQLAGRGAELVALSRGGGCLPDGTPVLALDLGREPLPAELLRDVDVVFHLAGIAHRQADGEAYRRVNHQATIALAREAEAAGVGCFLFLSSVKAMGPASGREPRGEEDCCEPTSGYARSKWQAECELRERFAGGDMAVVILRPALVYGARAAGNLQLLATAVRRGLPRPPAAGGRSMIARSDLVQLLCALGEQPPEGLHTWIVCDGESYSTRRIYDALRHARGRGEGVCWWPLWLWRLAGAVIDRRRGPQEESTFQRLFGYELYSNAALLAAHAWRPVMRLEEAGDLAVQGEQAAGHFPVIVLLATLALSLALCALYLRLARRWQIVDRPNERSSHDLPTPHGGGVPLLSAFAAGAVFAAWYYQLGDGGYAAILVVALFLMGLCVVDDLRGLSVRLRFTLYGICCLVTAGLLVPTSAPGAPLPALLLVPLAALAMLWLLNLYNFMDGIDGFASGQCVLAAGAAAALARYNGASDEYLVFCLLLVAAQLGFLVWNWPPARLFMGDAGSVPTGYLLAALALLGAVRGELPLSCWLILLAVFITDASWTLVWRILSGQNFTQAHRLHAYQRLSRRWSGHLPVDLLLLAIALLWLFPLSALVLCFPRFEFLLVILAYFPLLAGMAKMTEFA